MVETDQSTCAGCNEPLDTKQEHWVHISVFHHNDPSNPKKYSRDNPRNYASNYCPSCARDMGVME